MNTEQAELYAQIQDFPMSERSVPYPFAARLADDNAWSREYADRVIQEYKKFVFLKMVAGHPAPRT